MHKPVISLDHYATFLKVAETQRIDRAADALGLSASAVLKQIESTQLALSVRLFHHSRGSLSLTEDGQLFYRDAHQVLGLATLAEERMAAGRQMRERQIKLGYSTHLPPRLVAAIHRLEIVTEPRMIIQAVSGLTSTVLRQVLDGSLQAGIGILPLPPEGLLIRTIGEDHLWVALPQGHRLAARPVLAPQDLDGEPMIAIARARWPERHREIEEHLAAFGARAPIAADALSTPEALGLVENRVGLSVVARSMAGQRSAGVMRPLSTGVLTRRYGVFVREDNDSAALRELTLAALRLYPHGALGTR